jgi:hypothetical protein
MDTNPLPQDFAEFLKLLEDEEVEYLLNMISLEDLKTNKRVSARHKDLDDIEHLP